MPATARKPRTRRARPLASQPPILRLPWMDAYSAMRAVGLSWYAWVAEAQARLPGIVNHAGFDASLAVSRATAEAAKADAAAHQERAHQDVHSGRPIPEHMTGGCGEGDPGTSNVVPLTASSSRIWTELDRNAARHMAAFEQAHDEEAARTGNVRLLAPGEIPGPAPENGHTTTPSSTYELDWPQP